MELTAIETLGDLTNEADVIRSAIIEQRFDDARSAIEKLSDGMRKVISSYELAQTVCEMLNSGSPIAAVKEIRKYTQLGLRDSKRITDIVLDEMREGYDWDVITNKLDADDLSVLHDFAEGVIVSVVTLKRDHNVGILYTSTDKAKESGDYLGWTRLSEYK